MSRRITLLLIIGGTAVVALALGSRYVPVKSYAQLNADWRAERAAKFAKEREEDVQRTLRSLQEAMVNRETEAERRYARYEYRMLTELRAGKKMNDIFQPNDGVDQFEALLLSKVYFMQHIGLCGSIGMPEKKGSEWIVPLAVGRESHRESPIVIDALTGALRCEGHPAISDAVGFLRDFESPTAADGPSPTKF